MARVRRGTPPPTSLPNFEMRRVVVRVPGFVGAPCRSGDWYADPARFPLARADGSRLAFLTTERKKPRWFGNVGRDELFFFSRSSSRVVP